MLVLTRKAGERIVLAGGVTITVTVVECGSRRVRIGIDAPREIQITRSNGGRHLAQRILPKKG
jgi:carbon storage regulator